MTEILYNGIILPGSWPPNRQVSEKPQSMPIPYLKNPPEVIPIDLGRHLLIDDFLIEKTDASRTFYYPVYYNDNPILKPDKPWEYNDLGHPYAAPFSDGVWFDELDGKFKLWYAAGGGKLHKREKGCVTCYAESSDGIHWIKPELDIVAGTNIVDQEVRDSNTVWLDREEEDKQKRYKLFNVEKRYHLFCSTYSWQMVLKYSPDGIHWSQGIAQSGAIGDRSTVFYNPFRHRWIWSLRFNTRRGLVIGRERAYLEQQDPELGTSLAHDVQNPVFDRFIVYWFGPDEHEPRNPDPAFGNIQPSIYNHDAIAYESLLVGFFSVWQGPENNVCERLGIQKRNEVLAGYSRDGFHWHRPDHHRFLELNTEENESWNHGNMQSVAGSPLIVGDRLYFYVSGRRLNNIFWDSWTSTGLAILRRDGFSSMGAKAEEKTLETRKIRFSGCHLFVNVDAVRGQLRMEVLDERSEVVEGYSKEECNSLTTNTTKSAIHWKRKNNLAELSGKTIKLKFYLRNASLFSFWVSEFESGESGGYTAGGGPGLHPSGKDLPTGL